MQLNNKNRHAMPGFIAGVDVGGTKVHILDNKSHTLHRYLTRDYADLYAVLDDYFQKSGGRPSHLAVAMAGPRDVETGVTHMTNHSWPSFDPREAMKRYPDTAILTANDMVATAAGVANASNLDTTILKTGTPPNRGVKAVLTISTGVNACIALWDDYSKRYIFLPTEFGQTGFQPYSPAEERHLAFLFKKFRHPGIELALAGKHGVGAWVEHTPEVKQSPELSAAIHRAIENNQPIGAVLLEFATAGSGNAQSAAAKVLDHIGSLVGNVLADLALAYYAVGGVYLTGSVSMALGEYWAEHTGLKKAFVRHGSEEHALWRGDMLEATPIYLINDPHIAAAGAFALANQAVQH